MKRVYVAGAYSADNVLGVLDNMRKGMRLSTVVLLNGFAPFCPWLDYHFTLMLQGDEEIKLNDYYQYSLAWLLKSDALLLVPGWENSKGTQEELRIAEAEGIPIYHSLEELILYES